MWRKANFLNRVQIVSIQNLLSSQPVVGLKLKKLTYSWGGGGSRKEERGGLIRTFYKEIDIKGKVKQFFKNDSIILLDPFF